MNSRLQTLVLTVLATLSAGLLAPRSADACSCGDPPALEIVVEDAVPQNGGFSVWYSAGYPEGDPDATSVPDVVVTRDGEELTVSVSKIGDELFAVTIKSELEVGDLLSLHASSDHPDLEANATVTVGSAIPADATFDLKMTDHGLTRSSGGSGSCDASSPAIGFELTPDFSPELEAYREMIVTDVELDGAWWAPYRESLCEVIAPSSSSLGRHRYRLYTACENYPDGWGYEIASGVSAGEHDLTLTARLPGSSHTWSKTTTFEIDIECDGTTIVGAPDESPDDGEPSPDGDPPPDDEPEGADDSSGCATADAPLNPALWMLIAAFLATRLRGTHARY